MKEPINKVVLDTRVTRRLKLTLAERTLSIDYPILCWYHEPSVLRKKLGGLAQNIGQESGARGGNNQKQLRVYIRDINPGMNLQEIANILSGMDVVSSTSTDYQLVYHLMEKLCSPDLILLKAGCMLSRIQNGLNG